MRLSKNGLVTDGEGWFVVNARDSRWRDEGPLGSYCTFEGKRRFPHFGINISVLEPGERIGMYHRENAQEAFLILAGECTLLVEGGSGDLPSGISSTAPRARSTSSSPPAINQRSYWPSEGVAGASAAGSSTRCARRRRATARASFARPPKAAVAYAEVYAKLPRSRFVKFRPGWLPGFRDPRED